MSHPAGGGASYEGQARTRRGTADVGDGTLVNMRHATVDHNSNDTAPPTNMQLADASTCLTVDEAVDLFVDWVTHTPDLSTSTKRAYRTDVGQFLETMSTLGAMRVNGLDERHVEIWKSSMNGLGPATIRRKLVALSRFFDWARMQRLVTVNPVEFVKKPRKQRRVQKSVPLEHYELLLAACRTTGDHAMLGCLFWAGCRRQEVVDLDIGSVDLGNGALLVKGKGQHERLLPTARNLRTLLVEQLQERGSVPPDDPLFVNRDGVRPSTKSVNNWFRGLCKRAGLQDHAYTPHACRRGIAQLMDAQGFSILAVQAFMGHEDPKTTAGYVQSSAQTLQGKMDASPVFGEEPVETLPTDHLSRFEEKLDALTTAVTALLERSSLPADDGVYPIHEALQLGSGVGHDRHAIPHDESPHQQAP